MIRTDARKAGLALAGALAVLVYPLVVVVLQVAQRAHYDMGREAISELALGRGGWLLDVAFCALGVGTAALAVLMYTATRSRTATCLLALSAALTVLAAFVHADGDHARSTLHGQIHQLAGVVTFLSILVAMFVLARPLRHHPLWRRLGTVTFVVALLGIPAFLSVPIAGQAHFGIAQRLLIGLLLVWNVIAQLYARRVYAGAAEHTGTPGALATSSAPS